MTDEVRRREIAHLCHMVNDARSSVERAMLESIGIGAGSVSDMAAAMAHLERAFEELGKLND